nr:PREDICTED: cytoskeleton-associated protein 2-like isoform X2 [Latimeria chalumnae]|eukprot:XP_005988248.2 PREDICTED: cytoskeleton-associated protein 2-like isoform X2 [Latimeria chalumnae]
MRQAVHPASKPMVVSHQKENDPSKVSKNVNKNAPVPLKSTRPEVVKCPLRPGATVPHGAKTAATKTVPKVGAPAPFRFGPTKLKSTGLPQVKGDSILDQNLKGTIVSNKTTTTTTQTCASEVQLANREVLQETQYAVVGQTQLELSKSSVEQHANGTGGLPKVNSVNPVNKRNLVRGPPPVPASSIMRSTVRPVTKPELSPTSKASQQQGSSKVSKSAKAQINQNLHVPKASVLKQKVKVAHDATGTVPKLQHKAKNQNPLARWWASGMLPGPSAFKQSISSGVKVVAKASITGVQSQHRTEDQSHLSRQRTTGAVPKSSVCQQSNFSGTKAVGKTNIATGQQKDLKASRFSQSNVRFSRQQNSNVTRSTGVGRKCESAASNKDRENGVKLVDCSKGSAANVQSGQKVARTELLVSGGCRSVNSSTVKRTPVQWLHMESNALATGHGTTNTSSVKRTDLLSSSERAASTSRKVEAEGLDSEQGGQSRSPETERRRKLNEWLASKGRVYKRPSMVLLAKTPAKERQTRSFWGSIQEDDELHSLADQINQMLMECLQLIKEGCPLEEVNAALSKIPKAEKFPKYWICKAHLLERDSTLGVVDLYEEAVKADVKPLEELRAVVLEIMKNANKSSPVIVESNGRSSAAAANGVEDLISLDLEDAAAAVAPGNESPVTPKFTVPRIRSREQASSVKYQISVTPRLKDLLLLSAGHEMKILTPVRRSLRIEHASTRYPEMLKDHDPCVASLDELLLLDQTPCFLYRRNEALLEESELDILQT